MKNPSTLTPEEVDQFIYSGYIKLSDCFDIDLAASLVHKAYQRLGYDPDDPSTWKREIDHRQQGHVVFRAGNLDSAPCD